MPAADPSCNLKVCLLFQCMHALMPPFPLLTTASLPTSSLSFYVQAVLCDTNLTEASKYACWSEARTPRANCTDAGGCNFAYTTAATPYVSSVSPVSSRGGLPITVSGTNLATVTAVSSMPCVCDHCCRCCHYLC